MRRNAKRSAVVELAGIAPRVGDESATDFTGNAERTANRLVVVTIMPIGTRFLIPGNSMLLNRMGLIVSDPVLPSSSV